MVIVINILIILGVVFWLWTLVDVLKYEFSGQNKITWVLLILFLNVLGSILYAIIGRSQRINVPVKPTKTTDTASQQNISSHHDEDYWQRRIRETREEREKS